MKTEQRRYIQITIKKKYNFMYQCKEKLMEIQRTWGQSLSLSSDNLTVYHDITNLNSFRKKRKKQIGDVVFKYSFQKKFSRLVESSLLNTEETASKL